MTPLSFRAANPDETARVCTFYRYVCENTADMAQYAKWIYGKHPTDEMIRGYIANGDLYLIECEGEIVAAAALTLSQGEDYHAVAWEQALADDEVAVVHILCVDPARRHCGYARQMMAHLFAVAGSNGKHAVRLDALCCNLPAHRLYESLGFAYRGKQNLYADNTGLIDFFYYESSVR